MDGLLEYNFYVYGSGELNDLILETPIRIFRGTVVRNGLPTIRVFSNSWSHNVKEVDSTVSKSFEVGSYLTCFRVPVLGHPT